MIGTSDTRPEHVGDDDAGRTGGVATSDTGTSSGTLLTPAGDVERVGGVAPAPVAEKVSVKTDVHMRFKQVDQDGKVTQVDVEPKIAKRMFWAGVIVLGVSLILIIIATVALVDRLLS